MKLYILKGRIPVDVDDVGEWASWFENSVDERTVKRTSIRGNVRVSTVFLGIDHSWGNGEPQLFETLVFGGPYDGEMWRCATWSGAELMHAEMVRQVSSAGKVILFSR